MLNPSTFLLLITSSVLRNNFISQYYR